MISNTDQICELVVTHKKDQFIISTWGASILSWICNGRERLYVSPRTKRDGSRPVEGGISLVFPNFADDGPASKPYGFARYCRWIVKKVGGQSIVLTLPRSSVSAETWGNFNVELEYTVKILPDTLVTSLKIHNTSRQALLEYDVGWRTYYLVSDLSQARVSGCRGHNYFDKTEGKGPLNDSHEHVPVYGGIHRVYESTENELFILDRGFKSHLRIKKDSSLASAAIWNPGQLKARLLRDFPNEEYVMMLSVAPIAQKEKVYAGKFKNYVVELECIDEGVPWATESLSYSRDGVNQNEAEEEQKRQQEIEASMLVYDNVRDFLFNDTSSSPKDV